ncbi:MAG: 30S ribosomal protein S12 methylthiotransferase RimO [Planctomycetaceae bacterium]|jgi:ribosomal protein S12 methylthiotransferase|nr:30S ribosomal protein S12 methylthiotransferase RimO [Planctomycetaceae bacterium]
MMNKNRHPVPRQKSPVFSIISLGCPKNLTDSELIVKRLLDAGFHFSENPQRSDLVLVNTCGFLESARNEAKQTIDDLLKWKKRRKIQRIFVTGCAVQWDQAALAEEYPTVDAWFGVFNENQIAETALAFFEMGDNKKESVAVLPVLDRQKFTFDDTFKHQLTLPHVAYLKIADGCSRHCSYCTIPAIRGPFTSRSKESILREAKHLAGHGVRELILIAQESNFWGIDLYGKPMLAGLLAELQETVDADWIRLMYTYPMHFSPELIGLFAAKNKILPYIDIPLQHANDVILRQMNRHANKSETENLLTKLRGEIDGLVLRTSLIVGFPGETKEMFEELVTFVEKWQFERTGIFCYSPEKRTVAAELPGQIEETVKHQRQKKLYELTNRICTDWAKKQIGKRYNVIIDKPGTDENGKRIPDLFYGRTCADSPTIDPIVYVTAVQPVKPGDIVMCEIVAAAGMDMIGIPC